MVYKTFKKIKERASKTVVKSNYEVNGLTTKEPKLINKNQLRNGTAAVPYHKDDLSVNWRVIREDHKHV